MSSKERGIVMWATQKLSDLQNNYSESNESYSGNDEFYYTSGRNTNILYDNWMEELSKKLEDAGAVVITPEQSQMENMQFNQLKILRNVNEELYTIRLPRKKKKILKKFSIEMYNALYTNKDTIIFNNPFVRFDNVGNLPHKDVHFVITEIFKLQQMALYNNVNLFNK